MSNLPKVPLKIHALSHLHGWHSDFRENDLDSGQFNRIAPSFS